MNSNETTTTATETTTKTTFAKKLYYWRRWLALQFAILTTIFCAVGAGVVIEATLGPEHWTLIIVFAVAMIGLFAFMVLIWLAESIETPEL